MLPVFLNSSPGGHGLAENYHPCRITNLVSMNQHTPPTRSGYRTIGAKDSLSYVCDRLVGATS